MLYTKSRTAGVKQLLAFSVEQIDALKNAELQKFEIRVGRHLKRFFSAQCEVLGEEGLLSDIRFGISRSATYGIEIERDVCVYIDLMFELGQRFDDDPSLPWAKEILSDPYMPDPSGRVRMLYDQSRAHVASTGEPLPADLVSHI